MLLQLWFHNYVSHIHVRSTKGVDPDKKMRGTDWCVTQPFRAGGLGRCEPPSGVRAEPRRQTHFGTNVLKINSKSGPFSVAVYTPNSDPINDVHWLLQRKIGSVVRGCEKNVLNIRMVGCSTSRMIDSSGIILVVVRMAAPLAAR